MRILDRNGESSRFDLGDKYLLRKRNASILQSITSKGRLRMRGKLLILNRPLVCVCEEYLLVSLRRENPPPTLRLVFVQS